MEFDITDHTHYLVIYGSHAYGTNSPTSDYDLRGWAIPPSAYFLSFDKKFEQNDQKYTFAQYPFKVQLAEYIKKLGLRIPGDLEEIDHTIYDIRKFFALAAECNPNIIELLYVDEADILSMDTDGKLVRDNRDKFLSARAKHTFTGYAVSQLKRINTHRRWLLHPPTEKPTRSEYGLPETGLISAEQRGAAESLVDSHIRNWLLQDTDLDKQLLSELHEKLTDLISNILSSKELIIKLSNENELLQAVRLAAMRKIGMTENYISVLQTEKKYRDRLKDWNQHQTWKQERNEARAELEAKYGYDVKHGMQLVRLLLAGRELLLTGRLTVRRPDAQMLLGIRNGEWPYDKIITFLSDVDKELTDVYDNKKYVVPHKPDMKALSELCAKLSLEQIKADHGVRLLKRE